MMRVAADKKAIGFDGDWSALDGLTVRGDERAFRQIVTNLLGNAVKFTDRGGVTLHAQRRARRATAPRSRVAVTDTGRGIPAEALPHIFERFYQVDSSLTRGDRGHRPRPRDQPEPRADDGRPDRGRERARARLDLRLRATSTSSTRREARGCGLSRPRPGAADARRDPHRRGQRGQRDDPAGDAAQARLRAGRRRDGVEGIEMTDAHQPRLILMDLQMPRLDGFAAAAEIRRDAAAPAGDRRGHRQRRRRRARRPAGPPASPACWRSRSSRRADRDGAPLPRRLSRLRPRSRDRLERAEEGVVLRAVLAVEPVAASGPATGRRPPRRCSPRTAPRRPRCRAARRCGRGRSGGQMVEADVGHRRGGMVHVLHAVGVPEERPGGLVQVAAVQREPQLARRQRIHARRDRRRASSDRPARSACPRRSDGVRILRSRGHRLLLKSTSTVQPNLCVLSSALTSAGPACARAGG